MPFMLLSLAFISYILNPTVTLKLPTLGAAPALRTASLPGFLLW